MAPRKQCLATGLMHMWIQRDCDVMNITYTDSNQKIKSYVKSRDQKEDIYNWYLPRKGQLVFSNWVFFNVHISCYVPQQASCQGILTHHKTDNKNFFDVLFVLLRLLFFILLVLFICFDFIFLSLFLERERTWSWMGRMEGRSRRS